MLVQGRTWFGGSGINAMTAIRGSTDFYDRLAVQAGHPQWTYANLLPYMKFLENFDGIAESEDPSQRGANGPLKVNLPNTPPLTNFPAIISHLTGAPILNDWNVPGANTVVTTRGQRYCTGDGNQRSWGYDFLPDTLLSAAGKGMDGRKLEVKNGFVIRVTFEGVTAKGVEYVTKHGEAKFSSARKGVILCAGCPFSSAILERSGVGDPGRLTAERLGIKVVVANTNVGEGFKDHYGVIYGHTAAANPADMLAQSVTAFHDGRNYFAPAGAGDNVRRIQTLMFPFLNILPRPLLVAAGLNMPDKVFDFMPGVQGFSWILQPRTFGSSHIVSTSPFTPPEIRITPYSDGDLADPASDISLAVAMMKIVKQIADATGATMVFPPPVAFESDEGISKAVTSALAFSQWTWSLGHYAGTCRMGSDISNSVVSGVDLHVWGTEKLYVADNSVYPEPETGNNSWTAYLIGLKMADILRNGIRHLNKISSS
jgi:choline dehydrogenase